MEKIPKARSVSKYTWDDYKKLVEELAGCINWKDIKMIIGVGRGGMILAVMLSHLHENLPVRMFHPEFHNSMSLLTHAITGKNILVVDDVADSGKTMLKVVYQLGTKVRTATIHYKYSKSKFKPDWYAREIWDCWIKYPYEVYK